MVTTVIARIGMTQKVAAFQIQKAVNDIKSNFKTQKEEIIEEILTEQLENSELETEKNETDRTKGVENYNKWTKKIVNGKNVCMNIVNN